MGNWKRVVDGMVHHHRSRGGLLLIGGSDRRPSLEMFRHPPLPYGGIQLVSLRNSLTGASAFLSSVMPRRRSLSSRQLAEAARKDDESAAAATQRLRPPGPFLMVPPRSVLNSDYDRKMTRSASDDDSKEYYCFFSLSEEKVWKIEKHLRLEWQRELLTPDDAKCIGSSHGWLAYVHPRNCSVYLFNPFIRSNSFPYIPLPSIETLPTIRAIHVQKSCINNLSEASACPSMKEFTYFSKDPYLNEGLGVEYHIPSNEASDFFIKKLVLSSATVKHHQSYNQYATVMAILIEDSTLAFCKPRDSTWTAINGSLRNYSDIQYFSKDQRFYAVGEGHPKLIESWDFSDPSSPQNSVIEIDYCRRKRKSTSEQRTDPRGFGGIQRLYLVESLGDLLLVVRFVVCNLDLYRVVKGDPYSELEAYSLPRRFGQPLSETCAFDVYKLNFDHLRWESVECLGGRALFVGLNQSFSLSTCDFPELRPNSIYFTDDELEYGPKEGLDNGVFNLEDDCIRPCYPYSLGSIEPPPVWVFPSTL